MSLADEATSPAQIPCASRVDGVGADSGGAVSPTPSVATTVSAASSFLSSSSLASMGDDPCLVGRIGHPQPRSPLSVVVSKTRTGPEEVPSSEADVLRRKQEGAAAGGASLKQDAVAKVLEWHQQQAASPPRPEQEEGVEEEFEGGETKDDEDLLSLPSPSTPPHHRRNAAWLQEFQLSSLGPNVKQEEKEVIMSFAVAMGVLAAANTQAI